MDVSVIVCTYNRAGSLGITLRALDAQQVPAGLKWELVVVDNNSADATHAVVEAFGAAACVDVRYVFEARQGLSHARNAGIARASGAILAFTDDDVTPAPHWVASVTAVMRETGADIVGGRILAQWEHPLPPWLADRPSLHGAYAIMEHTEPGTVVASRGPARVWGANMAFRRGVFADTGVFDTNRGVTGEKLYGGEEWDLVKRALAGGRRAFYDPRIVVWHRIPAYRMRRRYLSRHYFERAEGEGLVQAPPGGRQLLGVPLFMYGQAAARVGGWLWAAIRRRPDALDRWLASCEVTGGLWGRWKRRARGRRMPP
ncbi:MAG TPA: glycosyltransferase [Methylomirabilota bacterium]|nr:glycosyltransferase [Methylomirabilota bacterium]